MKNLIIYLWVLTGNMFLFACIARLLTVKLITNDWADVVWFTCGSLYMIAVNLFYKKITVNK